MFNMNVRIYGAAILTATLGSCLAFAQTAARNPGSALTEAWHSDSVVYVAGLADVKPSSSGSLSLTQDTVVFANKHVQGSIPLQRITAVSIGDERVATGGSAGKVARVIPMGVGQAMGAVTNKNVGVLTIEYLDQTGGYHGAVFEVPKTQVALAQQQFTAHIGPASAIESHSCGGSVVPNTLLVEEIRSSGVELPAEYRALLYEELVDQLGVSNGASTVYRVGDAAAGCSARKLQISVTAFKKGNEALRASTGPVGLFVGASSVTFHMTLVDSTGVILFDKSVKASKHGDGDSLSVTRNLAKNVSKCLAKSKTAHSKSAA